MDLPDETQIMKAGKEKEIGNQGLKKKLIKEGEGWDTPKMAMKLKVIYQYNASCFPFCLVIFISLLRNFIKICCG